MKREEQIREAAKKTTGLFSYRNGYSTAEDAFIAGAEWADANPCTPDKVVKIPVYTEEEIHEMLEKDLYRAYYNTLFLGRKIYTSPWISVEERLPEVGATILEAYTIVAELQGHRLEQESIVLTKYDGNFIGDGSIEHMMDGTTCSTTHHWMPIPELPKDG